MTIKCFPYRPNPPREPDEYVVENYLVWEIPHVTDLVNFEAKVVILCEQGYKKENLHFKYNGLYFYQKSPNPNYNSLMGTYRKKLAEYEKGMIVFHEQMKEFIKLTHEKGYSQFGKRAEDRVNQYLREFNLTQEQIIKANEFQI